MKILAIKCGLPDNIDGCVTEERVHTIWRPCDNHNTKTALSSNVSEGKFDGNILLHAAIRKPSYRHEKGQSLFEGILYVKFIGTIWIEVWKKPTIVEIAKQSISLLSYLKIKCCFLDVLINN